VLREEFGEIGILAHVHGRNRRELEMPPFDDPPRIESLDIGEMVAPAEVPFAEMTARVPGRLEGLRDGHDLQRQVLGTVHRDLEFGPGPLVAGDKIGDAHTGGILAGHNAGARGRADGAGRVGVGEAHSLCRQRVDVGCLVKAVAVAARIRPAHVVNQNEHDVGSAGVRGGEGAGSRGGPQRGAGGAQKCAA